MERRSHVIITTAADEAFTAWLKWLEADGFENEQYDELYRRMKDLGRSLGRSLHEAKVELGEVD